MGKESTKGKPENRKPGVHYQFEHNGTQNFTKEPVRNVVKDRKPSTSGGGAKNSLGETESLSNPRKSNQQLRVKTTSAKFAGTTVTVTKFVKTSLHGPPFHTEEKGPYAHPKPTGVKKKKWMISEVSFSLRLKPKPNQVMWNLDWQLGSMGKA